MLDYNNNRKKRSLTRTAELFFSLHIRPVQLRNISDNIVAKLPTLDTLRAQLVGLLSAPATQLAMVLSEASGGKLARTLEGLKKSLEEDQSQDSAGPGSA